MKIKDKIKNKVEFNTGSTFGIREKNKYIVGYWYKTPNNKRKLVIINNAQTLPNAYAVGLRNALQKGGVKK